MDEALKRRLLGAAVLVALAIIFIPALLGTDMSMQDANIDKIPRAPERPPHVPAPLSEPVSQLLKEEVIAPSMPEPVKAKKPPVRKNLQAWVVQVGSFAQQKNAQRLADKLRKAKFQVPEPERVELLSGKVVYRVLVGPILQKDKAKKMLGKINTISGTQAGIKEYP